MRRRRGQTPTFLGGVWDAVDIKIKAKIMDEVSMFCPLTLDNHALIAGTVDPEILDILRKAKTYKQRSYESTIGAFKMNEYCTFTLDFSRYDCLVPDTKFITPKADLRRLLALWYADVEVIYRKWMIVRHVAKWMDDRASAASIRYYWPAMMALLPTESTKLLELHEAGVGTHSKEPPGIQDILPLCRETATTVTAGQMLPERDKDKRLNVNFSIAEKVFWHDDYTGMRHTVTGAAMDFGF